MITKNIAILNCNTDRNQSAPDIPKHGFINFGVCVSSIFPKSKITYYRVSQNTFPDDLSKYDCFFITGSPYGAYEKIDWIRNLKKCILEIIKLNIPLIGICFGHQIIAQALGGRVKPAEMGWRIGVKPTIFSPQNWRRSPKRTVLNLSHIHQDQVIQLPKSAKIISSHEDCPYESYTIGDTVLTLQGHPEFTNDFLNDLLNYLQKTQQLFSAQTFRESMQSFNLYNHGNIFFTWVSHFIENAWLTK